jgi:phosphoglycerate dehydrogenase-like enzyme
MLGATQLGLMKPAAILVNTSRGPVVDERALAAALAERRIAGAGLDSFQRDPLPEDSYLWRLEGTLITPRISGIGPHFWGRTHNAFLDNLRHYLAREPLDEVVDKAEWEGKIDATGEETAPGDVKS